MTQRWIVGLTVATIGCARKAETPRAPAGDTTRVADSGASAAAPATPTNTGQRDTTNPSKPPSSKAPSSKAPPPPPTAAASDTIRGIVAVVGTDRDHRVVIRPADGRSVTLRGDQAAIVGRAAGADVWASGTREGTRAMTVTQFAVRTVDGIPALDGTLAAEGERLVLVTADGQRHPIAHPPDALRAHVGGRVWVSGNLAQGPVAFGVLQDKR